MPIVDVHVHVYPDKIAERAVSSIGRFYGLEMGLPDGSVARMLEEERDAGVTHSVIHSVATKASNVESINDFIAATCRENDSLTGFMTLHQDYPDPLAEVERACAMGLKGIKLHPDTQCVNMDDPRLMHIYEIAEQKDLPVLIHCGDYRYDYSHPHRLVTVLHAFPRLRVDAAHFGGWSVFDYALECLENENCFLDMSSSQHWLGPRRTRELCEAYGPDRILFGSDFPMWTPGSELSRFRSLGFSREDLDKMLWHNAERFLGMEISN